MSTYERKMMEHLKDMGERRLADIDRLKKLIETKYNENMDQSVKLRQQLGLCQTSGKLYHYRENVY